MCSQIFFDVAKLPIIVGAQNAPLCLMFPNLRIQYIEVKQENIYSDIRKIQGIVSQEVYWNQTFAYCTLNIFVYQTKTLLPHLQLIVAIAEIQSCTMK